MDSHRTRISHIPSSEYLLGVANVPSGQCLICFAVPLGRTTCWRARANAGSRKMRRLARSRDGAARKGRARSALLSPQNASRATITTICSPACAHCTSAPARPSMRTARIKLEPLDWLTVASTKMSNLQIQCHIPSMTGATYPPTSIRSARSGVLGRWDGTSVYCDMIAATGTSPRTKKYARPSSDGSCL